MQFDYCTGHEGAVSDPPQGGAPKINLPQNNTANPQNNHYSLEVPLNSWATQVSEHLLPTG